MKNRLQEVLKSIQETSPPERELSIEKLARKASVSKGRIYKIIRGESVGLNTMDKISTALGYKLEINLRKAA